MCHSLTFSYWQETKNEYAKALKSMTFGDVSDVTPWLLMHWLLKCNRALHKYSFPLKSFHILWCLINTKRTTKQWSLWFDLWWTIDSAILNEPTFTAITAISLSFAHLDNRCVQTIDSLVDWILQRIRKDWLILRLRTVAFILMWRTRFDSYQVAVRCTNIFCIDFLFHWFCVGVGLLECEAVMYCMKMS